MNANQINAALSFIASVNEAPELVAEVLNKLRVKLEKNSGKAAEEEMKSTLRLQVAESRKALKELETKIKAERESARNQALLAKQLKEKAAVDKAAARESKRIAKAPKNVVTNK